MYRSQLVHMVALVRARPRIHKREHTRYQQRGFVMGDRIRPREKRTSLAVFALAITEEQRFRSTVAVAKHAGLAYKTFGNHNSVRDAASALHDKVVCYDIHSYHHRVLCARDDGAITQPGSTLNLSVGAYVHVHYVHSVQNLHIFTDDTERQRHALYIFGHHSVQCLGEFRLVTIKSRDISLVR